MGHVPPHWAIRDKEATWLAFHPPQTPAPRPEARPVLYSWLEHLHDPSSFTHSLAPPSSPSTTPSKLFPKSNTICIHAARKISGLKLRQLCKNTELQMQNHVQGLGMDEFSKGSSSGRFWMRVNSICDFCTCTFKAAGISALFLLDFSHLCPMDASALVGKWLLSDPFLAAGAVAGEGEPRGQWLAEGWEAWL